VESEHEHLGGLLISERVGAGQAAPQPRAGAAAGLGLRRRLHERHRHPRSLRGLHADRRGGRRRRRHAVQGRRLRIPLHARFGALIPLTFSHRRFFT